MEFGAREEVMTSFDLSTFQLYSSQFVRKCYKKLTLKLGLNPHENSVPNETVVFSGRIVIPCRHLPIA